MSEIRRREFITLLGGQPSRASSQSASAHAKKRPLARLDQRLKNPNAPAVKREAEEDWAESGADGTDGFRRPASPRFPEGECQPGDLI
jgi:hypothetical protein